MDQNLDVFAKLAFKNTAFAPFKGYGTICLPLISTVTDLVSQFGVDKLGF